MKQDIVLAGVGGQGILSTARCLSFAAMAKGLNVKQAEVHGMSQRGGAVYSHLRLSSKEIYSDLIPEGQASMVLAVEPMEALRYSNMLKEGGAMVTSTNAFTNITSYPHIEGLLDHVAALPNHVAIDMEKLARAAGSVLAANIVALGAASLYLPFTADELESAVSEAFRAKGERVVEVNLRAFRFGRGAAKAYSEGLSRGGAPKAVRQWIETLPPENLSAPEALDYEEMEQEFDEARLTGAEAHAFESILTGAYYEGRRQLYEHEVYSLLELVGAVTPPRHAFVPKGNMVDAERLRQFPGGKVVVKLVSQSVVHKSDAGAVLFVRNSFEDVRGAIEKLVGSHEDAAGTLVVEFVENEHRGFGGELFVGIRATREFGPVIAAGLGGLETEYLASRMKSGAAVAKAVVAETNAESFLETFKETAAYEILSGKVRGHQRAVSDGELLRCFRSFLSIAKHFCTDRGEEGPDVGELEVNPFAFRNQRLVPLDGRGALKTATKAPPSHDFEKLERMLEPRTIAIAGVSSKEESLGRIVLRRILQCGFDPAKISIVKPGAHGDIEGVRCVAALNDLPEKADLFVAALPATALPELIQEANDSSKVETGILISGGAGETDGSKKLGMEIQEKIGEGHTLWVGPNCMGVRSLPGKFDTFFIPEDKLPSRQGETVHPLALISQSGAFVVSRLSSLSGLNPAISVSIGNQAHATVSDFLHILAKRKDIQVAGVYLEGFADLDGAETLKAVRDWTARGKTVVFYKAGRTETGRSAAAGHTAAVAGDYDICLSAMEQAGALVAESFREFGQLLEVATLLAGRKAGQGRVFAITNAGMEAVAMADGPLEVARAAPALDKALGKVLKENGLEALVTVRNPLDLTPMASEKAYDEAIRAALESPEVGAVLVSCVPLAPQLKTLGDDLQEPRAFPALASKWLEESHKPIVFVVDSGPEFDPLRSAVRKSGLPLFDSADEAAKVLSKWLSR